MQAAIMYPNEPNIYDSKGEPLGLISVAHTHPSVKLTAQVFLNNLIRSESMVCSDIIILETLTLWSAQYSSICMIIWALLPVYSLAMVLYSTFPWKFSFPCILDIVSMRRKQTPAAIKPKTMNEIVGLHLLVSRVAFMSVVSQILTEAIPNVGKVKELAIQKLTLNIQGVSELEHELVVNPGPVIELISKAVPPQNPIVEAISPARCYAILFLFHLRNYVKKTSAGKSQVELRLKRLTGSQVG